jgi:hypothetical protein
VPRLYEIYLGICLTTEEKARCMFGRPLLFVEWKAHKFADVHIASLLFNYMANCYTLRILRET